MLFVAACVGAIVFSGPHNWIFLAFIPYILIFWVLLVQGLDFFDGLFWGLWFYGTHFFLFFSSLLCSVGSIWLLFIGWIFATFYCAAQSGIWFWILERSKIVFCGPIIAAWLFLWWFETKILWIFGICEGYPFLNPLLCMARSPIMALVLSCGMQGAALLFLVTAYCGALCIKNWASTISYRYGIIYLVLCFFWNSGFLYKASCKKPLWLDTIEVVRTKFIPYTKICLFDCMVELCEKIRLIQEKKPHVKIIITPESTITYCLNQSPRFCSMILESIQKKDLFLGSYRKSNNGLSYNSCYWFSRGQLYAWHDKKHGVPFIERMPQLFNCSLIFNIFFNNCLPFSQGTTCNFFCLNEQLSFVPLLCSEFFFIPYEQNFNQIHTKKNIVLALVNDAWFSHSFFPCLMSLCAQLIIKTYGLNMIYVSYYYAYYMDLHGLCWNI